MVAVSFTYEHSRSRGLPGPADTGADPVYEEVVAMRGFKLTVKWTARSLSITLEPY